VAAFTQQTFEWGDYVAGAFQDWLEDPNTAVFVATTEGDTAIGLVRSAMVSPVEAWLASARVHPGHRRRGLASALNDLCMQWARERGALVARLVIEDWNEQARRQVLRLGFRSVGSWTFGTLDLEGAGVSGWPRNGRFSADWELEGADETDAEPAFGTWGTSDLARAAHGLIPFDWTWRAMTLEDVLEAARSGELLGGPEGWTIAGVEGSEPRLNVRWLSAPEEGAVGLIGGLTRYGRDRFGRIDFRIPALRRLDAGLDELGYTISHLTVFEKETALTRA